MPISRTRIVLAAFFAVFGASASAHWTLSNGSLKFVPEDPRLTPPTTFPERIKFGKKRWQQIKFFKAAGETPRPLVVVFNDLAGPNKSPGGWLRYTLNEHGYSLAFLPDPNGTPDASEVTKGYIEALVTLRGMADELNLDPHTVFLLGSGGGALFATLFGTDPHYLESVDIPFENVRGVVAISGTFDIPNLLEEQPFRRSSLRRFFGKETSEQIRWSPTSHLEPPNAPAFILMANEDDEEGLIRSRHFQELLEGHSIPSKLSILPRGIEGNLSTYFLAEDGGSGADLLPFLDRQMAREAR